MEAYKTSKDYKHLKELVDKGYKVVCFTTYDINEHHKNDKDYEERIVTDICWAYQHYGRYYISSRGLEYGSYWEETLWFKSFEEMCEDAKIEFIEPDNLYL